MSDEQVWAIAREYETAHRCYGGAWEEYVDEYLRSTASDDQSEDDLRNYLDAYGE